MPGAQRYHHRADRQERTIDSSSGPGSPPWRHAGSGRETSGGFGRSLKQLAVAALVVALVALAGGWLFARGDAPAAARLLLDDEVIEEPLREDGSGPRPARPTSGPQRAAPSCGIHEELPPPAQQVATLAAGVVIVGHAPGLDAETLESVHTLVERHDRVLIAPGTDPDHDLVATAWRHRYEQPEVEPADLERFIVGWGGRGPDPRPCR